MEKKESIERKQVELICPDCQGPIWEERQGKIVEYKCRVGHVFSPLSMLGGFREALDLSELIEWTMEANPGSVSAGKAGLLHRLGISRISLGIQSWDDDLLKLLGREHSAKQGEESFAIFRDAGFLNINVDLMFGLPGQTVQQWRNTLERTVSLRPEHISTYCLTYEEDTDFFLRHARGEFRQDSDADAEFFEMTMSILEAAGYEQYEISNYARPGFRSAHNRAYWSGSDYLGIGPSAFSTVGMTRFQNVPDFRRYADTILSGKPATGSVEQLTPEIKRAEKIALSLRTLDGAPAKSRGRSLRSGSHWIQWRRSNSACQRSKSAGLLSSKETGKPAAGLQNPQP